MEKSEQHFDNLRGHFANIIRQNALWLRSMIPPVDFSLIGEPLKQRVTLNKKRRFSRRAIA